jgi:hypothetical protein
MTEQVQYPRRCSTSKPPIRYVSAKSGIWPDLGSRREHATVLGTELGDLQNTYSLRVTSPHCTHGTVSPTLKIDRSILVLSVHGPRLDVIEVCSKPLMQREFHLDSSGRALAIETPRHDIGGKNCFDLEERYINGESAFFAYTQTLSTGCVATSLQEARPYHKIPKSEWLTQGAVYLTKALG